MARFEKKYVFREKSNLSFFLTDLKEWMGQLGFVETTYEVESLYFDFPDLRLLRQKEAGEWAKNKFRLRGYPGSGDIFWEKKSKLNQRSFKERTALNVTSLSEFENDLFHRMGLIKTCLIRYTRRVWSKPGSSLRLNIDRRIRGYNYYKNSDFFLEDEVVEFKHGENSEREYSLITSFLGRHGMTSEPFSKYFLGMHHESV